MKIYKKWSDNERIAVVEAYLANNMTLKEICQKYGLSTSCLIYNWVKKYSGGTIMAKKQSDNIRNNAPITFDEATRLAEENKILKQKINELEAKYLRSETEVNLLKKPLACDKNLRISITQITLKSKLVVNKCYKIVSELKELGYTVKEICKYLPISPTSVSLHKHKRIKKINIYWDPKLILVLKDYLFKNKVLNGLENIRLWIKANWANVKCSKSSIKYVINLIKLPKIYIDKTLKKKKYIAKTNVQDAAVTDKIQCDFSTTKYLHKIGLDGSWIMPKINNKIIKFLLEMAYDFHTTKVIGYHIGRSENSVAVSSVIKQVIIEADKQKLKFAALVQSDCGSANLSNELKELFSANDKIEHSFSLAAFKGNQPTECMNRWIKDKFENMYGNEFDTTEKFVACFEEFINWWNKILKICNKFSEVLNSCPNVFWNLSLYLLNHLILYPYINNL